MGYKDKSKRNEAERRRYAADPEKKRAQNRALTAKYPEKKRENNRHWELTHREQALEASKRWAATHPEEAREKRRAWDLAHPENKRASVARYSAAHRDVVLDKKRKHADRLRRTERRERALQGLPVTEPYETEVKQQIFLETFKGCGNITVSCEAAGISRAGLAYWRATSDEFEQAFEQARIQSVEILEAVARQRAMAGSDRLLIFLLRALKPETYGQKVEPQVYLRTEAEKLAAEFGVPFEQVYNELLARANERTTSRPQQLVGPGRRATEPAD